MLIAKVGYRDAFGIGISTEGSNFQCKFGPGMPSDEALLQTAESREIGGDLLSIPAAELKFLPPLSNSPKIICVGLNYAAHAKEVGLELPSYPTIFVRFASGLVGHDEAIIRPVASQQLDFEGELAAVIGKGGRHISKAKALDHVIGYSLFNDGSIRDFQLQTSQWTVGKNFDGTGGFGPWLATADQLPPGCANLKLQTRLNGEIVQSTSTNDLIFDVAALVSTLSGAFTLSRGDVIVTGTPSGVGAFRTPPLWMKPGDICEVEVDQIGVLRNTVADEEIHEAR